MEMDQRETALHSETQAPVIWMLRIGAAISISKKSIRAKGIVVRPGRRGGDRQWHPAEDLRLEDTLRSDERDPYTVYEKPVGQNGTRKDVALARDLIRQPLEGGSSHTGVLNRIKHKSAQGRGSPSNAADKPRREAPSVSCAS